MRSTKDKLLYLGFTEFLLHGFTNTSINSIVEKAGITKGGFYHHFKSKKELFTQVLETYFFGEMQNYKLYGNIETDNLEESVITFFLSAVEMWQGVITLTGGKITKGIYNLIFQGVDLFEDLSERFRDVYRDYISMGTELFALHQRRGTIREDVDPQAAAFALVAAIEGMLLLYSFNLDDEGDINKRARESANLFLQGLIKDGARVVQEKGDYV